MRFRDYYIRSAGIGTESHACPLRISLKIGPLQRRKQEKSNDGPICLADPCSGFPFLVPFFPRFFVADSYFSADYFLFSATERNSGEERDKVVNAAEHIFYPHFIDNELRRGTWSCRTAVFS